MDRVMLLGGCLLALLLTTGTASAETLIGSSVAQCASSPWPSSTTLRWNLSLTGSGSPVFGSSSERWWTTAEHYFGNDAMPFPLRPWRWIHTTSTGVDAPPARNQTTGHDSVRDPSTMRNEQWKVVGFHYWWYPALQAWYFIGSTKAIGAVHPDNEGCGSDSPNRWFDLLWWPAPINAFTYTPGYFLHLYPRLKERKRQ